MKHALGTCYCCDRPGTRWMRVTLDDAWVTAWEGEPATQMQRRCEYHASRHPDEPESVWLPIEPIEAPEPRERPGAA